MLIKSIIFSHRLQTVSAALNYKRSVNSARERNKTVKISNFGKLIFRKAKTDRNSSSVLTSAERLVKPPVSLRLGPVRVLSVHRTLIHCPHAAPLPAGEG